MLFKIHLKRLWVPHKRNNGIELLRSRAVNKPSFLAEGPKKLHYQILISPKNQVNKKEKKRKQHFIMLLFHP